MTTATGHRVGWVAPPPLWDAALDGADPATAMRTPLVVGMAGDDFMDRLQATLLDAPETLADLAARPEGHSVPLPGASSPLPPVPDHLKLYQPVHGRFYLVMAAMVCARPGLPTHAVIPGPEHRLGFVLRRLAGDAEEAWSEVPEGGRRWTAVPAGAEDALAAGEELLPMFPMRCGHDDAVRPVWAGLIPTGTSEEAAAPAGAPTPGDAADDPDMRILRLERTVIDPLVALGKPGVLDAGRVEGSRWLLLDLAEFLRRFLPGVWAAVAGRDTAAGGLAAELEGRTVSGSTWAALLRDVWAQRARITGEDPTAPTVSPRLSATEPTASGSEAAWLRGRVVAALPKRSPGDGAADAAETLGALATKHDPLGRDRYVIRCVLRRPACGVLGLVGETEDVVSDPTGTFAIANLFDPDAPARPIRIALPLDTSVQGLRAFRKNVSVLIGSQLQRQMSQVTDLKKALDGNVAEGKGLDIGLICSFSIPLITICALVVLMIFLILLNLVFFWLPFIRICLPAPRIGSGS